jgi:glycosyltransferase involved in cell wall biosynthesis
MNPQAPAKPRDASPRISVVLSAYNGERFLRAQLDSILAQSFADFELIAVDDASSDGSFALLQEYARRDGRLSVSRNARNVGLPENLAALFGRARAPWIAISDHDDVWHPRKLEKLLERAGSNAAVYCNSDLIDGRGRLLGLTIMDAIGVETPASGDKPLKLMWKNCVSGHSMIFRRELCGAFLPFSADLPYDQQIAILAMASGGLAYCPEPLIQHRLHESNFCNHSLLQKPERDLRRRTPAEQLLRRRLHRKKLTDRIVFFERKKLIPRQWRQVVNSDRIDKKWFDLGLFTFVLRHPELFTQRRRHRTLHVAFKFAKGAAWYRTVNAWRLWLSGFPGGGANR